MRFRCRDFIETEDGLVFAVVGYLHPEDRVIGFLRFVGDGGRYRKSGCTTLDSYAYLSKHNPEYLYNSKVNDTVLQAVPIAKIKKIIRPDEFLSSLKPEDVFKRKVIGLAGILSKRFRVPLDSFGVTGSVLVDAHTLDSDIDLVVYGLDNFNLVRQSLPGLVGAGLISELGTIGWKSWYSKRLPGKEISFREFMWHEKRKKNSGVFNGTKFDVLYARDWNEIRGAYCETKYKKFTATKIKARILDDKLAFDYPATYKVISIEGKPVKEIVSYTHTYAGQAFKGETVQANGILEEVYGKGVKYLRLLVGSTREARGEYIKVTS